MKIIIVNETPQQAADVARREWMKSDRDSRVVIIDHGCLDDYKEYGKLNRKSLRSTIKKRIRSVTNDNVDVVVVPVACLDDETAKTIEDMLDEFSKEFDAELLNTTKT